MLALRRALRRSPSDDSGLGLILVIGVSVMVFALAATAVSIAVNALSQSRQRTEFEVSLAVAEVGIDRMLSEVQGAYTATNSDYPAPGPTSTWCPGSAVAPGGPFLTEVAERNWARAQLEAMVAANTCVQTDERGQYVVLKPTSTNVKYGTIYSLSAVPSFGASNASARLVKSEYVFMPYRPTHAILTAGPLDIESSTTVTGAAGVDPNLAAVHTNSTMTGTGNPTVTGPVTSTSPSTFSSNNFDSNPGGTVATKPAEAIPNVSAATFYMQAATNDPAAVVDWYDLCASGVVRPYSSGGPCTAGTTIGTADTSTQVRGWKYDSGNNTWIATSGALSGTYYAHQANVDVGPGNGTIAKMTVIASASNPTTCGSKVAGNIAWDHFTLGQPGYHNLWFMADSDIKTSSNFSAGSFGPPVVSGMFIAGDQIELTTSSQGAVGAVMAGDQCPTTLAQGGLVEGASVVKNPAIYFDPNSDAPFASVITTALWLDYSGVAG